MNTLNTSIEFGLRSPIHVKCEDKGIALKDLNIPNRHIKLLKVLFKKYETKKFNPSQKEVLRQLDRYLDIPLVEAVLDTNASYESFRRLVENNSSIIPSKYRENKDIIFECIKHDSLPAFQKALELGCEEPFHYTTMGLAVMFGSLTILTYAHKHKYEWTEWTCSNAIACNYSFMPTLICFTGSCYFNDVDTMYIHRRICPKSLINDVKEDKVLQCLQYAMTHGCSTNVLTCAYAAAHGRLTCLQYLHEQQCLWDHVTCIYAAANGHLDCLQYAHENGCEWTALVCIEAVGNGQLECLQYAHDNDCPWSETTFTYAAEHGCYECLTYLATHRRYVYSKLVVEVAIKYARKNNHTECVTYLSEHMSQNCAQADDLYIRDRDSWKNLRARLKD
jgi:hypothetical protein